jgi:hypothetical protein
MRSLIGRFPAVEGHLVEHLQGLVVFGDQDVELAASFLGTGRQVAATGEQGFDRRDRNPAMAAGGFPGFEGAAFHHVLHGAEGNAQSQGRLPGAEIFGVRHD